MSWSAEAPTGSPILDYTVTATDTTNAANGGQTCVTTSTSCSLTGLTTGDTYTFSVTATNGLGTGPATTTAPLTMAVVPGAPTGVSATVASTTSLAVTWSAPASNGGAPITGYTATATQYGTATTASCTTTGALSCTITGLTTGDHYTVVVTATNAVGTGPASTPYPDVVWTTEGTALGGAPVAYGNGTLVAVSNYGTATEVSTNGGATWTAGGALPITASWTGITYGNGMFVAVGDAAYSCSPYTCYYDYAAYSTNDGQTWTLTTLTAGTVGTLTSVTYGNGVFVAASTATSPATPFAAYSTNGYTWSEVSLPSTSGATGVAYGNGDFVAVGIGQADAYVSTNGGQSWSTVATPGAYDAIAYGAGAFVATGYGDAAYSTNGATTWTASTIPTSHSWYSVAFGDGVFTTVSQNTAASEISLDGATWTALTPAATLYDLAYDGSTFVATSVSSTTTESLAPPLLLATAPGAPAAPTATVASTTSVTVSWPADTTTNGSPVTAYTVTATDQTTPANGGETCTTAGSLSCVVSGLTTGDTYTFTVTATNGIGTSPASPASNAVIPASPPSAPNVTGATVTSVTSITVTWSAATPNGAPITGYTATATQYGTATTASCTTTGALSCTITGLTTGDHYTVAVTATNSVGTGPASAPYPTVTWGTPTTSAAPYDLAGLAYGAGTYMAVDYATSNEITTSSDGLTWTAHTTLPYSAPWAYLAYGNGTFVTVTSGSTYYYSAASTNAGTSWGLANTPFSDVAGLAYANGVFVIWGGSSGTSVATSTNGLSWTSGTLPTAFTNIVGGDGQFIATSSSSTYVSTDGQTWTAAGTLPETGTWRLAYGNGVWAALDEYSSTTGYAAYSTDGGATWVSVGALVGEWAHLAYGDGLFVATTANTTATALSADGQSWLSGPLDAYGGMSLVYGSSFIASDYASTTDTQALTAPILLATAPSAPGTPTVTSGTLTTASLAWSGASPNGSAVATYTVTATDQTTPANGGETCVATTTSCTITGLTAGDTYTFAATATNSIGTGPSSPASNGYIPASAPGAPTITDATVASPTGATVTWTAPASNGGAPITLYTVTAADQTTPANGGETCTTTGALSCTVTGLTSGDGYSFTVTAANDAATGPASAAYPAAAWVAATPAANADGGVVAYGNGLFMSLGAGASTYSTAVMTSPNGQTWTAGPALPANNEWDGLAYGSGTWVAVGAAPSTSYALVSTNNGASWTSATLPYSGYWTGVAYQSGAYVAVGWRTYVVSGHAYTSSVAAYSTNGTTWTGVSISGSSPYVDVTAGNGEFMVSVDGAIYTSTNGSTWTATTSAPTTSIPSGLAYSNGVWVLYGYDYSSPHYPWFDYSTNTGASWTADGFQSAYSTNDVVSVTPTPTGFLAVGGGQSWTLTSTNGATWNAGLPLTSAATWSGLAVGGGVSVAASGGSTTSVDYLAPSTLVIETAPGAPTGASATVASTTSATVTWSAAPANGSPVTLYTVTAADTTTPANGGQTCTTSGSLTCTVAGLTTGDTYTFSVTATNAVGTGPASAPSNAVSP